MNVQKKIQDKLNITYALILLFKWIHFHDLQRITTCGWSTSKTTKRLLPDDFILLAKLAIVFCFIVLGIHNINHLGSFLKHMQIWIGICVGQAVFSKSGERMTNRVINLYLIENNRHAFNSTHFYTENEKNCQFETIM